MRYICTHTDFNESSFPNGTIIASNSLNNKYNLPIIYANNDLNQMQYNYAEGFMIYDIWKKDNNSEFIELNHYRRHFQSINTKDITILPIPIRENLIIHYAQWHNINDLLIVFNIIDNYFPNYSLKYGNINEFYNCNMFKMRHEDFNEYCNFVFGVLNIFNELNNFKSDTDVKTYISHRWSNEMVMFQSRLQGFLMERIGTIFFLNYFKDKKDILFEDIIYCGNKIINY